MPEAQKAEQLMLPEQLYILLMDPDTGEPRFDARRVERALSMAVLWELLDAGAFETEGNRITRVDQVTFGESYMRRAALAASKRAPANGRAIAMHIAAELHPIWRAIGEDMVNEHLVCEDVQTRFCFFHKRVLTELADARRDDLELENNLRQAARGTWDAGYDDQLAKTHPRLLARMILLDNYGLLEPLLGSQAYDTVALHIPELRKHVHQSARQPDSSDSGFISSDTGGFYGCGPDFWIYDGSTASESMDGGEASSSSGGSADGSSDSSSSGGSWGDSDSSSSSGGDSGGGDCGGCGGCGS